MTATPTSRHVEDRRLPVTAPVRIAYTQWPSATR